MKTNKMRCFLFALFPILLSSCEASPSHIPVNSDLKKYFNYQVGTYWVYKDPISGKMDSVYVTNVLLTNFFVENSNCYIDDIVITLQNIDSIGKDSTVREIMLSENYFDYIAYYTINIHMGNPLYKQRYMNYEHLFQFPFALGMIRSYGKRSKKT